MNRRATAATASALAALAVAPAAHADCCTTYGPELGPLIATQHHALLGYATLDGDDNGNAVRYGAYLQVSSGNIHTKRTLPAATPTTPRSVPSLSFAGGSAAIAWVAGGTKKAGLAEDGSLVAPSVESADGSDADGAKVAGALVAHPQGRSLWAGGVMLTSTLATPEAYDVVGDSDGNAAVVWADDDGIKTVLVPKGTAPQATQVKLLVAAAATRNSAGRWGILATSSDGAGGVRVAFASGGDALGMAQLASVAQDGHQTVAVLAQKTPKVKKPSVALSPGAVAYLAGGKKGNADVMVRRLIPGAAPTGATNLTRTTTSELSVEGIADVAGESTWVLYRRVPKHQHGADVLLNTLSTRRGVEVDISRTKDQNESQARLAVDDDAIAYIAYLTEEPAGDDEYAYDCGRLRTRTFGPSLTPARTVATCDVASAI